MMAPQRALATVSKQGSNGSEARITLSQKLKLRHTSALQLYF